jgi:signal peptidase I
VNNSSVVATSLTLFSFVKGAILAVVIVIGFIMFIGVPLAVRGNSMEPNFHSGQVVLVDRISLMASGIKRGDVVAAKFPADPKRTKLIKRVIGLPGETIKIKENRYYVNGETLQEPYAITEGEPPYDQLASVTLGENEYYLSGDNRPGSSDSRLWGAVERSDIEGRVSFVLLPLSSLHYVDRVSY